MHKIITKSFIFLSLLGMLFTSGCSRKNDDIVLVEPERAAVMSDQPEEKSDSYSDSGSNSENSEIEGKTVESAEASEDTTVKDNTQITPQTVMVHVCGAVLCEGVYELPSGSRVVDAVRAAGGFSEEADSEYVNQALVLSDGVKVRIPTLEETTSLGQSGDVAFDTSLEQGSDTAGISGMYDDSSSQSSEGGKVNINTADEAQLCTIPGIGPSRAKSIITYRQENGRFGTIEDIMKVSGIKDKFFSKIKDYITV